MSHIAGDIARDGLSLAMGLGNKSGSGNGNSGAWNLRTRNNVLSLAQLAYTGIGEARRLAHVCDI